MPPLTPSQTVGPFFAPLLFANGGTLVAPDATPRVTLEILVVDGEGRPVPDAMLECWQADPNGHYPHPADPVGGAFGPFDGFGRAGTDENGRASFTTVKPGPVVDRIGVQAPHLALAVFARGLLTRLVTRIYFEDEPANAHDPVLAAVAPERRRLLVAPAIGERRYRFDLVLQGDDETPFFDV